MKKAKNTNAKIEDKKREKINAKEYVRNFLLFVDKNLSKTIKVLLIIAILLIAITLKPVTSTILTDECAGTCSDNVTFFSRYTDAMSVILVTGVASIVPYLYAPVVGFFGYILSQVSTLAYVIKGYGYLGGILLGIIPLILNLIAISMVTALGIYVCKSITLGYKISNMNNMNWLNFRIELYDSTGKKEKAEELKKQKDEKLNQFIASKKKIDYMQVLNVAIVASVIQFVATLIQHIIM